MPSTSSPFNTPGNRSNLNMSPSGQEQLKADALALQLLKENVENRIKFLPPDTLSADRLNIYNNELEKIKDKFYNFSDKVSTFCVKYVD